MRTDNIAGNTIILLLCVAPAFAQEAISRDQPVPLYRVTVVERTIQAINYNYRTGPTQIDFRGTVLLPAAKGEATVESKRGRTTVDAKFQKLLPAQRFGREYLTYVLWAITPEGAPRNIGEVIPGPSDNVNLEVTTDLQAFALIVTAEPHSAVRQPSDVVVLENYVRSDTTGRIQQVTAKYELMPRGHYVWNKADSAAVDASNAPKVSMREYEAIAALYQAENAIGIANAANASEYAPDTLAKAQQLLAESRTLQANGHASSQVVQIARQAAQTAEDARTIAERRGQAEKIAAAETETLNAHEAKTRAEERAQRAENEANRARAEAEGARAQAEAERVTRQQAEAQAFASQTRAAQVENEANRVLPSSAGTRFEEPGLSGQSSFRRRILEELNGAAVTRDTPKGLVVTITNDEFQKSSLSGAAAQQIMRVAAIVARYPALRTSLEGHSGAASDDALAGERVRAVRDALAQDGLSPDSVTTRNFGSSRPIGPNSRANQRVEIVIYGDPIGTTALWNPSYSLLPR